MSRTEYSFQEKAQVEFCKRKGFSNTSELLKEIGVREYRTQLKEFYISFKKENEEAEAEAKRLLKQQKKDKAILLQKRAREEREEGFRLTGKNKLPIMSREERRDFFIEEYYERFLILIEELKKDCRQPILGLLTKHKINKSLFSFLHKSDIFENRASRMRPEWYFIGNKKSLKKYIAKGRDEIAETQKEAQIYRLERKGFLIMSDEAIKFLKGIDKLEESVRLKSGGVIQPSSFQKFKDSHIRVLQQKGIIQQNVYALHLKRVRELYKTLNKNY